MNEFLQRLEQRKLVQCAVALRRDSDRAQSRTRSSASCGEAMSKKPSFFFAELKAAQCLQGRGRLCRCRVVGAAGGVVFLPAFDAPPVVMQVLIILLVLCFPVALALSWAFEITPEGIKLEAEVAPNESITRRTGRKLVGVTIAVAVIAAGLFVFQ
jgi:hypothetical protein